MNPTPAFIALGSNLGDRRAAIEFGLSALAELSGVTLVEATEPIETLPLGGLDQPPYLNAMALLLVTLPPHDLLSRCQEIEKAAGRIAREPWASRELDLDIVRYGDVTLSDPILQLPHPGISDRAFWQDQLTHLTAMSRG